jgi:hypothetical protein
VARRPGTWQDHHVPVRVVAILALSAALLAGCGSSGSKSNGVENKTAPEIVQSAKAAAKGADSVHIAGTVNAGGKVTLDLSLARGKGGKGKIVTNGMTFEVISTGGKVYFKTNAAALQRLGGGIAAQLLQGRWIIAPSSLGQFTSLTALTDMTKLFDSLTSSLGTLDKGATTDVNGQPAVTVTSTRPAGSGTLYVATTGEPFPLKLEGSKSNAGSITFDQWNEPVDLKPPPNPVDFSKLSGG